MKKTLLLSLAIYATVSAQAQIPKNSTLIGGQFSFNTQKNYADGSDMSIKNNSQNFNLSIGKAFKENKVIGVSLMYSHYKNSHQVIDTFGNSSTTYSAGMFYRQYAKLANRFYAFGQADAYYSFSKAKDNQRGIYDSETKSFGTTASITPGVSYQLLKKLHVELTLPNLISMGWSTGKTYNPMTPDSYSKRKSFSVNTAFTNAANLSILGIGFRFVI